jgi:hypothetical protein
MDTHIADDKLKELHVEDTTVKANRDALQYEIDPAAEKKLLRKIDLHVVPILWFLFMYVSSVFSAILASCMHVNFACTCLAWLTFFYVQACFSR